MKTYICDICQKVIDNPYKMKMREFYVGVSFFEYCCVPEETSRKTKIHLCGDCFEMLKNKAKKVKR